MSEQHGDLGGSTVLVSNTDRHFGAALALHLQERGFVTRHLPSAREALYRWEDILPRCVVTGFDDGEVDGFEFLQAVTARAAAARLPRPGVLLCARQQALAQLGPEIRRLLGIDLVLERPCRLDAVGDALSDLLAPHPKADRADARAVPAP